eukprot:scaffold477_cov355-Pinguiococcus_pyrenoidosus.AAC.10
MASSWTASAHSWPHSDSPANHIPSGTLSGCRELTEAWEAELRCEDYSVAVRAIREEWHRYPPLIRRRNEGFYLSSLYAAKKKSGNVVSPMVPDPCYKLMEPPSRGI